MSILDHLTAAGYAPVSIEPYGAAWRVYLASDKHVTQAALQNGMKGTGLRLEQIGHDGAGVFVVVKLVEERIEENEQWQEQ